jgi:hypothetical protein
MKQASLLQGPARAGATRNLVGSYVFLYNYLVSGIFRAAGGVYVGGKGPEG